MRISPSSAYHIEDLDLAGGIPAVMSKLLNYLNLSCKTVTGKPIGENISRVRVLNSEVIRNINNPYSNSGGLSVLFGNLAQMGV